jgi:hypothetical protein
MPANDVQRAGAHDVARCTDGTAVQQGAGVLQRVVRIGGPDSKIVFTVPDELREAAFDEAGSNALSIENLAVMASDEATHVFDSWQQAFDVTEHSEDPYALVTDDDEIAPRFWIPPPIANSPGFQLVASRSKNTGAALLIEWAMDEVEQLVTTAKLPKNAVEALKGLCAELIAAAKDAKTGKQLDPKATTQLALRTSAEIALLSRAMFSLDPDRQAVPNADVTGKEKYGYHLTKVHNIPGIAKSGLDPGQGASTRGSVATSTVEQQKGSHQTSTNMVAFALKPSTFKPYINQFEDRRQMIEGTPEALKPIMLRFVIEPAIGTNILYGKDYMDKSALNTTQSIAPEFIEVLTPNGWVPIASYKLGTALVEHRSGNDNTRVMVKWAGTKIVMTWDEMLTALPDKNPFVGIDKTYVDGQTKVIAELETLRDKPCGKNGGVTFTFRGATMQTSGNPKTWSYAFTIDVDAKNLPKYKHLERYHVQYLKTYEHLAAKQVQEYELALKAQAEENT